MKLVQYRRDWLQCLVDAILFVLDHAMKGLIWLIVNASPLSRQGMAAIRKEPQIVYVALGGPLIAYVGLGLIRCFSVVLSNNPNIYYMPVLDWWWVYIVKLLH
jgi:hypothetical protein